MFQLDDLRYDSGGGKLKHCSMVIDIWHEFYEDALNMNDLRAALVEGGCKSFSWRSAACRGRYRTKLNLCVPSSKKTFAHRVVRSHFHCLNLREHIDHNEDSAQQMIAAAANERMGLPMLSRLRTACVIYMRAIDYILRHPRVPLPHSERRQLEDERDVLLGKIAAIDKETDNRFV
ncbi:MAG: hypothetical protein IID41_11015 [Planctomycetes bacterium]|nr:hypothetical protein [Planctomycetota bacterium]